MHKLALAASRGALVLKEFEINEGGPNYIRIVGRRAGIIGWLLSLVGIDPTTTFVVSGNRIEFSEGSLSGLCREIMPISSVCNLGSGFFKPILLILMAVVFFVGGIFVACSGSGGAAVSLILLSGVLVVIYFLRKTLMIYVLTGSGCGMYLCVKRSVIEGVRMDEEQARRVVALIHSLVESKTSFH